MCTDSLSLTFRFSCVRIANNLFLCWFSHFMYRVVPTRVTFKTWAPSYIQNIQQIQNMSIFQHFFKLTIQTRTSGDVVRYEKKLVIEGMFSELIITPTKYKGKASIKPPHARPHICNAFSTGIFWEQFNRIFLHEHYPDYLYRFYKYQVCMWICE